MNVGIIYQRALFNRRVQKLGESIDDFITDLHKLAKDYNYGNSCEEMIRDRLVVGVRDIRLLEKMQLHDNLDYKKAIETARNYETVLPQNRELHQSATSDVGAVNRVQVKGKRKLQNKASDKSWKCYFCGGSKQHERKSCPARESTCNKCNQAGHWAKTCKKAQKAGNSKDLVVSAKVNAVANNSKNYFIGTVNQDCESALWEEIIGVGDVPVKFRLDSGADVTIIKSVIWDRNLRQGYELVPAEKRLIGLSGQLLETEGRVKVQLKFRQTRISRYVYVVRDVDQCLLGRQECVSLKLIARCSQVTVDPFKEFQSLFSGLGRLTIPYEIKIKSDIEPYCLNQPRRVPLLN